MTQQFKNSKQPTAKKKLAERALERAQERERAAAVPNTAVRELTCARERKVN